MSQTILRIAVPSPLRQCFDYLLPENVNGLILQPGARVKVPWRNKHVIGILLETAKDSLVHHSKLKPAQAILDETPLLPNSILRLATWAADYYQHGIGEVMLSCLPTYLRQGKTVLASGNKNLRQPISSLNLNLYQQKAVDTLVQAQNFQTYLLDGVTGSGKTEVYLQTIDSILQKDKQILVLVPEIGLTPQTIARFEQRFAVPIVALHSGLNEKQRAQAWLSAKAGIAKIVIGTRSAIFTPLLKPGMIIIDEEHDISFKQHSGFRYSARDLAMVRGQLENIPVVLGSATPSLESLHNSSRKRFHYLHLPERAGAAIQPQLKVIDVRNQSLQEGLSKPLLTAIEQHLQQKSQVLLFLNRRGFAPTLLCHSCGWMAKCQRCDARMTMHQKPRRLFCHHCNSSQFVFSACQSCKSTNLLALGLGTERLEQALNQHFPTTEIIRIDRDSTRKKNALQNFLAKIENGEQQILIGTQMLTKGHHFPNVTLVAIVDTDSSLFSSDFRASERMGQLITQVAGRAGRAEKPGEVLLQTHFPKHPLITTLIAGDYSEFAKILLQERKITDMPPYSHLALLRAESVSATAPLEFLKKASEEIKKLSSQVQLLGPMPATMARKIGKYHAQLFVQAKQRKELQIVIKQLINYLEILKSPKKVRWSIDIDPQDLS